MYSQSKSLKKEEALQKRAPRLLYDDYSSMSGENLKQSGKVSTDNQFHNILRLFDVLPNFPFTTNETMCKYFL